MTHLAESVPELTIARSPAELPLGRVERRRDERHLTVLRVAKLILNHPGTGADAHEPLPREVLCLIRDISSAGMMVRTYSQLATGDAVTVELRHGHHVEGTLVWVDGASAGIRFDHRVDVLRLLSHDDHSEPPKNQRLPRLAVEVPVDVCIDGRTLDLTIRNISIGGVRVEGRHVSELVVDARVMVDIDGFGRLPGVVRWQQNGAAGIAFLPALPLRALSHWAIEHGERTEH